MQDAECFPIALHTLNLANDERDSEHDITPMMWEVFAFCKENPGEEWSQYDKDGRREPTKPSASLAKREVQELKIARKPAGQGGCVIMSVANCVHDIDPLLADEVANLPLTSPLPDVRAFMNHGKGWDMTKGPVKALRKRFKKNLTSLNENMLWLLEQRNGLFLARPFRNHSDNNHIVGVDCCRRLIFDSTEVHPLRLSEEALALCSEGEKKFKGVEVVGQLSKR